MQFFYIQISRTSRYKAKCISHVFEPKKLIAIRKISCTKNLYFPNRITHIRNISITIYVKEFQTFSKRKEKNVKNKETKEGQNE